MREADRQFTQGLRYLQAARRCSAWCGEETTMSQLGRLAVEYRRRAHELMGIGQARPERTTAWPPLGVGAQQDERAVFRSRLGE